MPKLYSWRHFWILLGRRDGLFISDNFGRGAGMRRSNGISIIRAPHGERVNAIQQAGPRQGYRTLPLGLSPTWFSSPLYVGRHHGGRLIGLRGESPRSAESRPACRLFLFLFECRLCRNSLSSWSSSSAKG